MLRKIGHFERAADLSKRGREHNWRTYSPPAKKTAHFFIATTVDSPAMPSFGKCARIVSAT
jgi:hypothetical protein